MGQVADLDSGANNPAESEGSTMTGILRLIRLEHAVGDEVKFDRSMEAKSASIDSGFWLLIGCVFVSREECSHNNIRD
jgi:hypothetical protein